MKSFLIWMSLILIVLVQVQAITWEEYKVKFNKTYKNAQEDLRRYNIFNDNLRENEKNKELYEQGVTSHQLSINKFTDLTDEEFERDHLRDTGVEFDIENVRRNAKVQPFNSNSFEPVPESIDWRNGETGSVVTRVKDQGICDASWAFSAVASIESHLAIQTGELKSLSEQQLVDCDTLDKGCSNGLVNYAYAYTDMMGLTLEDNYPYQGIKQDCDPWRQNQSIVWTRGYASIKSETDLKEVVGTIGPVSVVLNMKPARSYTGGILTGTCLGTVNHAVLVVGYGTNKTTKESYWILKNSWGSDWGEQGYFRLLMGQNLCGIATSALYPIIATEYRKRRSFNSGYVMKRSGFYLVIVFMFAVQRLI